MADQMIDPRHVTILMVDDAPANVQLLADMLVSRGYTIQVATSGKQALAMIADDPPDIVLLDIFMPDMDGYDVCARLKADPATTNIPVMFISALAETDDIVRGFDVGGVDYITKPFKFQEVMARVVNQLMLVHQRREIEALREQDRQHFELLDKMKNEFLRMATHDLRNPLNVILGYTGVLERIEANGHDNVLLQEAREGIEGNVEKMRALVTDILDLAKMETGGELVLVPVSLTAFLERSLSGFYRLAEENGITLVWEPPDYDVRIVVDASHMMRVVDNLLSNALKYTPQGGQITVAAVPGDGHVVIDVADTGLGVPEADLPYLFDAFYRVDNEAHGRIEGSGLGLSIVKTIVEQHGGTIHVDSQEGQGSVFSVTLPLPRDAG